MKTSGVCESSLGIETTGLPPFLDALLIIHYGEQMPTSDDAPFRRDTATIEDARLDGFITGSDWNNPWMPGSPWAMSIDRSSTAHPDIIACAELSKARHTAWLDGFQMARRLAS